MSTMTVFIVISITLLIGAVLGILITALCCIAAASDAEVQHDRRWHDHD